jgi:hypothetical protein
MPQPKFKILSDVAYQRLSVSGRQRYMLLRNILVTSCADNFTGGFATRQEFEDFQSYAVSRCGMSYLKYLLMLQRYIDILHIPPMPHLLLSRLKLCGFYFAEDGNIILRTVAAQIPYSPGPAHSMAPTVQASQRYTLVQHILTSTRTENFACGYATRQEFEDFQTYAVSRCDPKYVAYLLALREFIHILHIQHSKMPRLQICGFYFAADGCIMLRTIETAYSPPPRPTQRPRGRLVQTTTT